MGDRELEQRAALLALLRLRPNGLSWNEIAAEVAHAGSATRVWSALRGSDALLSDPADEAVLEEAAGEVSKWEADGLHLLTVLDADYPSRLLEIRETPPFLFAAGQLVPGDRDRGMSVVGSRKASERGLSIARAAAGMLVERGLTVIAGLAEGIDSAAHRAALELDGRTVAIIGTGIRKHYPAANRALQDEIARRGLVLSQFFPDAPPTKQSFPMRNAVMSGYGLATIVVEAGETSGTRIQARLAVEHGRPVILTDDVVRKTTWGSAMQHRPGVFVVSSPAELAAAIDEVLARQEALGNALGDAMRELAGSPA